MSKKKPQAEEVYTNSTCRYMGHAWIITTSDIYRKCMRNHCRATQRFVNGEWVNALQERPWVDPRVEWAKQRTMPKQASLFSSRG